MAQKGIFMSTLTNMVNQEITRLKMLVSQKEISLTGSQAGRLRISVSNDRPRYYYTDSKNLERYLSVKKDRDLIRKAAQTDYDHAVLPVLKKKLALLECLQELLMNNTEECVYASLHPNRKEFVKPTIELPESRLQKWLALRYTPKEFAENIPVIISENGIRVRSKSEKIIADKLYRLGIPFKYEYPVTLKGYGPIHPDFYIFNRRTCRTYFYEHFGKMDDPGYSSDTVKKINAYILNGYYPGNSLIFTCETKNAPISDAVLDSIIHKYFL